MNKPDKYRAWLSTMLVKLAIKISPYDLRGHERIFMPPMTFCITPTKLNVQEKP